MKKGRHRRYEEARKFKRSHEDDLQGLIESLQKPENEYVKPEHAAWAEKFAEQDSEGDEHTDERATDSKDKHNN